MELTWVTAVTGEQFLAANNVSKHFSKSALSYFTYCSIPPTIPVDHHLLSALLPTCTADLTYSVADWPSFHNRHYPS
jgi:hypothetical protein